MSTLVPILEVQQVEVIYQRAITAVQGVSFTVAQNSITGLVGTNGAGKSTILSAIAGFIRADDAQIPKGDILFEGSSILGQPSHRLSARGIAFVPERNKIFPTMTVVENLRACGQARVFDGRAVLSSSDIFEIFPNLKERAASLAGYLSGGERQMLAISMALLSNPRFLMIDELSLGLAPIIITQLLEIVEKIRRDFQVSVLLVEQNARTVMSLCDYIYVVENGRMVFEGTPEKLNEQADFREFYLGVGVDATRSYRDVKQYQRKRRWFG